MEILITSSSRPQLWPYFWKSFKEMIHYRDKNTQIKIHEDFIYKNKSHEACGWINANLPIKRTQTFINKPAIGLGYTLDFMIKRLESKYTFYTQEDWEFERPVDLDQLMWVMDENPHINLIFLNKINNLKIMNGAPHPEREFSGVKMCVYHAWTFLPGLWRTDFVKRHWRCRKERPEGFFTNTFGNHDQRMDVDYCERTFGAYSLGASMDWRYARHIGNDWRMAEWRRTIKGGPGGVHDKERMDLPYMAPWIEYKERPTRLGGIITLEDVKDSDKLIDEEPKEVREYVEKT